MILAWEQVDENLPDMKLGVQIPVRLVRYTTLESIRGKRIVGLNYVSADEVDSELHTSVMQRIASRTFSLAVAQGGVGR